ncbi:MAG: hypothetical protein IJQ26_01750 [Lachnospiraceae bacterium]|nr:hypothetical protein [Lachnospiraceae bacterium]
MKDKRKWMFRGVALAVVIAVAVVMFIIGRGHTVYFDNKAVEVNGQTIDAFYKVVVNVKGEKVASLKATDRGMCDTMGQTFTMDLEITKEKDGDVTNSRVKMPLPYGLDGVVINLPALMAGNDQSVYMEEFIPLPSAADEAEEEIPTDEFGIEMEMEDMGEDF